MLSMVGAKTDGPKNALALRIVEAAVIDDLDSLTSGDVPGLTDLQVAYVLQRFDSTLSESPADRRSQLLALLDTVDPATSGTASDTGRSADLGNDNDLRKRLSDSEREVQLLRSQILAARRPPQASPRGDDDTIEVDDVHDLTRDSGPSAPSPSAGSLQLMASSIAAAITDGMAAANESTSSSAISAKIERTHPASIDPRKHNNDPHRFGLLVKRMIDLDSVSAGLAGRAWRHTFKTKSLEIQALCHAEASRSAYIEGESLFISLVNECLGLAIEHDKDAGKYASLRVRQLSWWLDSFNTLKQDLRNSTRFWKARSVTFRMQMEDLICTALGLGFSNTQLRALKTSLKLRSDMCGGDSGDDDDVSDCPRSSPPSLRKRPRLDHDDDSHDSAASSLKKVRFANPGWSDSRKSTGTRMPIARSIVGASTPGAQDCDTKCEECGEGGTADTGHRKFECPSLFAREHPGKSMPGFDKRGRRIASMWDGANITTTLKSQWVKLQSLGFFSQPPFRKHPDAVPVMRG